MNNRYDSVPDAFGTQLNPGSVAALPSVNREQAQKIATLIVRKFWPKDGRRMPAVYEIWQAVRGNKSYQYPEGMVRRVWISKRPTATSNSNKGLGRLVHDLSHDVFDATYRSQRRAHDPLHARYEIDIAEWVGKSPRVYAILHPKPKAAKPAPTKVELRRQKIARLEVNLERWESKQRRADNAIAKIKRQLRGLLRAEGPQ